MRLLDRYLLRELLVPLGYCLCGFLIFWIAFDLFGQLHDYQDKKLLAKDILEIYFLSIPGFIVLILPMTLLLALLYALTNHARCHELTAMRAAGVSLWRICVPYVFVGLFFTGALFVINEFWAPNSNEMVEQIKLSRMENRAGISGKDIQYNFNFPNARDGRTWHVESYNTVTHVMTRPTVTWNLTNEGRLYIIAERAQYLGGVWNFYNVQGRKYEPGTNSDMVPIPQAKVMTFPEFTETPEELKREISFNKRLARSTVTSAEVPIADILDYLQLHPDMPKHSKWRWQTQLQGRLAAPWTCLVVVFIAIPFGAASGRRNVFVGVASSIVICFVYFILLRLGLALGTGGYLPAWLAAWLPNMVFGISGIWLTLRVR
ncbi:MAG: Permease YjgP/YjgQ family protein [Pedosphaera sp.]|nr:Permease YjgP/YjgQ family protein [Pedosphaera sp.]